jgi:hypothetical protein
MKLKDLRLIAVAALMPGILSCIKPTRYCCGLNPAPLAIAGKWNIVGDTTYSGVNTGANPTIYNGTADDYFDFRMDGYVYIKEGAAMDTLNYNQLSAAQVSISSFTQQKAGMIDTCTIAGFTLHNSIIVSPLLTPPSGPQQRKVGLTR